MRLKRKTLRRGGAVLELVLTLPVFIIALFAIIEYGFLLGSQQQLVYASRIGALVASETDLLPATDSQFAGSEIDLAVRRHLGQAGIDTSDANLRITLDYLEDAAAVPQQVVEVQTGSLPNVPAPQLPSPPTSREFVRLTVYVEIVNGKLTPNLLKTLGFDIEGRVAQQTTTLRWERAMTP